MHLLYNRITGAAVGAMTVGMTVGAMTVGAMTVGAMTVEMTVEMAVGAIERIYNERQQQGD